jgi:hypothetical protein
MVPSLCGIGVGPLKLCAPLAVLGLAPGSAAARSQQPRSKPRNALSAAIAAAK